MRQQVNLYQSILREVRPPLAARTILAVALVLAVGLGAVYGYLLWQTLQQREAVTGLEAKRDQAQARLEEAVEKYPPPEKSEALQRRLEAAQAELTRKRHVLEVLGDRTRTGRTGFAGHLRALARQRTAELWLTGVRLYQGGAQVELAGSTYVPEQVPQFLQRLAREERFDGLRFADVRMERPEKTPDRVDFRLRSERDTGEEGAR